MKFFLKLMLAAFLQVNASIFQFELIDYLYRLAFDTEQ